MVLRDSVLDEVSDFDMEEDGDKDSEDDEVEEGEIVSVSD